MMLTVALSTQAEQEERDATRACPFQNTRKFALGVAAGARPSLQAIWHNTSHLRLRYPSE